MITQLPDDIAELLANTRQTTAEEITALENAAAALREDSRFAAECAKATAREEILRSMQEADLRYSTRGAKS